MSEIDHESGRLCCFRLMKTVIDESISTVLHKFFIVYVVTENVKTQDVTVLKKVLFCKTTFSCHHPVIIAVDKVVWRHLTDE